MAQLCPGKKQYVKKAKDLDPAVFRRLVARRARALDVAPDVPLPTRETVRRKTEKLILEKVNLVADFLPASFLSLGAQRARAVCRMVVPTPQGRSLGTGFLVMPNVIMTNNHVLDTAAVAENATAEFQFEAGLTPVVVLLRPAELFVTDKALDFTLVACEGRGLDGIDPIPLTQDSTIVTRHERVNVIQHPSGRPKEIAIHDNRVTRVQDLVLKYSTDTEPGSSGSPVFNNGWDLVALHHAGVPLDGGKAENEGIRIPAIVDHLTERFRRHEAAGTHDPVRRLLESLHQTSPLFGFFGTTGLDRGSQEIQVDGFQGTAEFADIGVWNIEHFNGSISDERVKAVADVVNQLQLDVFGLTEVETSALNRLVASLRDHGSRYDFVLRDTQGSQDIAVLFDTDTTTVTRRKDLADRHISQLRARTSANKTAFPRFPLFAQCKVGDGANAVEFILIVVHLKAFGDQQSQARRRLAAEMLAEIIEDIRLTEKLPVVLGGDMNQQLETPILSALTGSPDLFTLTADDHTDGAISFVGQSHRSLIDHIIVSSDTDLGDFMGDDAAIVRLDRRISDFSDTVSDHVPVVFRMIMRNKPLDTGSAGDGNREELIAIPVGATEFAIDFR